VFLEFDGERGVGTGHEAVVLIGVRFEAAHSIGEFEVIKCPAEHACGRAGRHVCATARGERGDGGDRGGDGAGVWQLPVRGVGGSVSMRG
jgi:hypothetical protein